MYKNWLSLGLILSVFSVSACTSQEPCESAPITPEVTGLSSTQSALKAAEFVGDAPAARAYERIQESLEAGKTIRMNIYRLSSSETIETLAAKRLPNAKLEEGKTKAMANSDERACQWGKNSLYEECIHPELFNHKPGIARQDIYPDGFYLERAQKILDQDIDALSTAHYQFLPYKRKLGIVKSASNDNPQAVTESVFEVAVGFTSELDGWPVIGPGGKAYIHMLPDGTPTAQKVYRKIPTDVVATLDEKDIKTPDEALAEAIKRDHIQLDRLKMVRKAFGYFYWGKNSIQNIIAPYYVFFFQPADGEFDTTNYYIVSAVKGDAAKIVEQDYALEQARKAEQLKNVKPAQEK
jgi:hypothetical protein